MKNQTFFTDYVFDHPWTVQKTECNTPCRESVFPIVCRTGENRFEILSGLPVSRLNEVWGYQIAPDIIIARDNYECDWPQIKFLCRKFRMNNKEGRLLSIERLVSVFNQNLYEKICEMTSFLQQNGIDASASGEIYSRSEINGMYVWTYGLSSRFKQSCLIDETLGKRLVVTF